MQLNMRLIKILAAVSGGSLAVSLGAVIFAAATSSNPLPTPAIGALPIAAFTSLFWLWAYWLLYFHRTAQRREFWLCYCLPYLYSSYRTVALLRGTSEDAA